MAQLQRTDLMSLEAYARERDAIRRRIIEHRRRRQVALGEHITLSFEDRDTVWYQIQEMLRTERIFEEAGILDELAAYNPLIPDGGNFKATMMIEYPDPEERAQRLRELRGVERKVWLRIGGGAPIFAIADEDLERENEDKTSAVHFLRFELDRDAIERAKVGEALAIGVEHPHYAVAVDPLPPAIRDALLRDLK
jgi:hypothetical protein